MDRLLEFATANLLLVTATLLMLVALVIFELRIRSRAAFEVTIVEAVRMINAGATVVDIRDKARFDAGHIVDAINIPAGELVKGDEARIKKKRGVVIVCDTGSESHRCARALRAVGFEGAFSLGGGVTAWQRENQPLVLSRR